MVIFSHQDRTLLCSVTEWEHDMGIKINIVKAGVIPYYFDINKQLQMMFMLPSASNRYGYQIAKGSIERNETLIRAALREAKEELGLKNSNIDELIKPGIIYNKMAIFPAKISNPEDFNLPSDPETREVKWMTLEEFHQVGLPGHLPVLYGLIDRIRQD